MLLSSVLLALICFLYQVTSHILIPPFLPDGYQNQYYEQKFRISQLDTAQFKISGLPKDIFWTSNGTIFGTPSNFGQWKINIVYDSLTQSGNYQTVFLIKGANIKTNNLTSNNQQSRPLEIIFPESLIFQKSSPKEIEFTVKNAVEPVEWKFTTLPKGVSQGQTGKLLVNIEKEGFYILRIQVSDYQGNQIQACLTLNVQSSKSAFSQSYALNTIYEPSQNVNRLLEITKKETEVTKQLTVAALKLDQESEILKQNEESFKRVGNNLIQLQNEAKYISQLIEDTLRDKRNQEQKLKEAYQILKDAQDSLNLAMIEQQSNNNLLKDSQNQKAKAQDNYDKAAKSLQGQTDVLKSIQNRLLQKQQQKDTNVGILALKRSRYSQLANTIVAKEKQLTLTNESVAKIYGEALAMDSNVKSQSVILKQEQSKYSNILNNLNQIDTKIQVIQSEIQNLANQKGKVTNQITNLNSTLKSMETNDLFNLQKQIQYNDLVIETMLFDAIKDWNSIQYQSSFLRDYLNKIKFGGCNLSQYPSVQGIFTIKEISQTGPYYQTESGHRILYGPCTKTQNFAVGNTIIVSGHTSQGVIHADKIVRQ